MDIYILVNGIVPTRVCVRMRVYAAGGVLPIKLFRTATKFYAQRYSYFHFHRRLSNGAVDVDSIKHSLAEPVRGANCQQTWRFEHIQHHCMDCTTFSASCVSGAASATLHVYTASTSLSRSHVHRCGVYIRTRHTHAQNPVS